MVYYMKLIRPKITREQILIFSPIFLMLIALPLILYTALSLFSTLVVNDNNIKNMQGAPIKILSCTATTMTLETGEVLSDAEDIETYFCTILPTDDLYYDMESSVILQNVNSEFPLNFLVYNKVFLLIGAFLLYYVVLLAFGFIKKNEMFRSKQVLYGYTGVIILYALMIGLIFILLG